MVPKPVVLVVDGHLFSRLMGVEISLSINSIAVNMVGVMTLDNLYQDQCLK